MVELVIKNGKVVFPSDTIETSIAIDQGKIVAIGSSTIMPRGVKSLDAKGKFVLPGCIDPHVHVRDVFMGATANDDFFLASKATSLGGTTTIIDFAIQKKACLPIDAVQERRAEADGEVVIDYSLHPSITDLTPETIDQLKELIDLGLPSFKLFLVYRKDGLMVDDGTLWKVFEETKAHGGLVGLHAENVAIIDYLRDEALRKGHRKAIYHAYTRPPITEAEAINRAMFLANHLNAPYYNFHLTIKEGVEMFREERKRGRPMYTETCTHYLVKTIEDLKGPKGINFICTPPLRQKEDQKALWKGLADGTVSVVSSDQVAFTAEMKKLGEDSFDKVPNGVPGHEFRLPILFSEGVRKKRININKLSEITSTNAAKIFGLYPKKGIISVGSDADIVIFDPNLKKTITTEDSLYNMDWYPYEGMTVKGYPVITISKGKIIWENWEFQGKKGDGEFLRRTISRDLLRTPVV